MNSRGIKAAVIMTSLLVFGVGKVSAGWGCYGVSAGCYGFPAGCYGVSAGCYGVSISSNACYGDVIAAGVGCYGCDGARIGPLRRLALRLHSYQVASACYGASCYGTSCYGASCYGASCYGASCYGASCYGASCYCSEPVAGVPVINEVPGAAPGPSENIAPPVESPSISAPAEAATAEGGGDGVDAGATPTVEPAATEELAPEILDGAPAAADGAAMQVPAEQAMDISAADATVKTTLTLRVPSDAKVILAGHRTRNVGTTRVFSTAELAVGEAWEAYEIQVVVTRNGRDMIRRKTVTVHGGDSRELRFDFDAPHIASNP